MQSADFPDLNDPAKPVVPVQDGTGAFLFNDRCVLHRWYHPENQLRTLPLV